MGAWGFSYDTLNRLSTASAAANAPAPYAGNYGCWTYDAFGNRTMEAMSTTACTSNPAPTSWANLSPANNNRLAGTNQAPGGVSYDASGDVLNDGVNQYLYDAEGRICAVASTPIPGMTVMTGYLYDAGGTRVAKGSIQKWSCDPAASGFQTINDYVLGLGGEQVTEMGMGSATTGSTTSGLAWQHTNVWAAGKLLGTYDNDGLHFYLDDPLGTRRVQTDYAGVVEKDCASLPYGDGESCAPTPTEHLFTGKERDAESGNDYFEARYYSSAVGRFMSPDWSAQEEPVPYAQLDDPQSLNLYAYVRNNPLTRVDADGHWPAWVAEATTYVEDGLEELVNKGAAEGAEMIGGATGVSASAVGVGIAAPLVVATVFAPPVGGDMTPEQIKACGDACKPPSQTAPKPNATPTPTSPAPPTPTAEHTKNPSPSKWDDHTKRRPGTSPPPNYKPDRKHEQPKHDKKKDREKPPYRRKDRDK